MNLKDLLYDFGLGMLKKFVLAGLKRLAGSSRSKIALEALDIVKDSVNDINIKKKVRW